MSRGKEKKTSSSKQQENNISRNQKGTPSPIKNGKASFSPLKKDEKKRTATISRTKDTHPANTGIQGSIRFWHQVQAKENQLAKFLRKKLGTVASNTILLLFFTLVGLNAPANYPPLFTIIRQHQVISIISIVIIVLYFIRVLCIGSEPVQEKDRNELDARRQKQVRPLFLFNILSSTGSILFLIMLLLLLMRPSWCPGSFCPVPQHILITHPQSIHDENLEMYLTALQSVWYVIPDEPSHYTIDNLPTRIGALHTDGKNSTLLYHLILGLQSLQQGRFGMTIQAVNLVIQKVSPIPHPLNVWGNTSLMQYENENQYRALYLGQEAGAMIPTAYLRFQYGFGFVHLKPKESDQIDIHIVSRLEANICFSVQVIYSADNDLQLHTLMLPQEVEVMFANNSDWHPYNLKDGHFVASS